MLTRPEVAGKEVLFDLFLVTFFCKGNKKLFFFHKNSDFELLWKVLPGVSIGPCLWCQGVNGCVGGWARFRVSLSPSAT